MRKILFAAVFSMLFSVGGAYSQAYKFEGFNLILQVPQNHRVATCAVRYVPPTTEVKITDLDPSTPLNLKNCGSRGSNLVRRGTNVAVVKASAIDYKWCFEGEDDKYQIEFTGDQWARQIKYIWPATLAEHDLGVYNIRDFGAKGDGTTDDTLAIRSALAYVATRNGGRLKFPEGEYMVGGERDFESLALPSGIVIEGISGLHTGAATNNVKTRNPSRIVLKGKNRSLFRIGECVEAVTIRDIELYAQSNDKTIGVEGMGAYSSAQGFQFERMSFNNFYRGIHVEGLPQTNLSWQFDYVKIKDSRFIFNADAGIYVNSRNSDWKIEGALFINPAKTATQNANSMHFERVGLVLVEDTFAGGFAGAKGGTFINMLDNGSLTVIGSQAESVTNAMVYNGVENPYAGDFSYPITFINNIFFDPIIFKARRTFVSTGTLYGPRTFQAQKNVRVYSTGDRFCYDGATLKCLGQTNNLFDNATVVFMTGQPTEPGVGGHPTFFGTDVEFGDTAKMMSFRLNELPRGKTNGSMVYCADCRRDSTPCRGGGSGAPAMVVNGEWSCL